MKILTKRLLITFGVLLMFTAAIGGVVVSDSILSRPDRIHLVQMKADLLSVYDQILRYEYENLEMPSKLTDLVPTYLREDQLFAGGKALFKYDKPKRTIALAEKVQIKGVFSRYIPPPVMDLPGVEEHLQTVGVKSVAGHSFSPEGVEGIEPPAGTFVFEAENYTQMNYGWELHPDPKCGGGAYAYSKEGMGNGPGQINAGVYNFYDIHESKEYNYIRWHFRLEKAGFYYIYGRFMTTGSHCSNSIIVGIDGAAPLPGKRNYRGFFMSNRQPFSWLWTPAKRRVRISAGDHFLEAYLHEDGVRVDQFALSPTPLKGNSVYKTNLSVNQSTDSSRKPGSPLALAFDLKSMVITSDLKPECNLTVRKLRSGEGKALIRICLKEADANGKDLNLGEYVFDLAQNSELIFIPIDFSKLNFSSLQRREYLLVAELTRKGKLITSTNVPLIYPFSWEVCGPFPLIKNGRKGPLDGDSEPTSGDAKTGEWQAFKDSFFDHFACFDFGLYTIGNSLHAPENVTIYAKTEIDVPETGEYLLKIQSDDQLILWIDGKQVYRHDNRAPVTRSVKRLKHHLTKGQHRIRIRVNQWHHTSYGDGRWQASLRFRTADDSLSNIVGEQ